MAPSVWCFSQVVNNMAYDEFQAVDGLGCKHQIQVGILANNTLESRQELKLLETGRVFVYGALTGNLPAPSSSLFSTA